MRGRLGLGVVLVLAACAAPETAPAPLEVRTPDRQEGGPVTRVVTMYFYEDGSDRWSADVTREALGAPGTVDVIGPGPASRAQFFAAKACIEDGGTFRTDVVAVERPMPSGPNRGYLFEMVCG